MAKEKYTIEQLLEAVAPQHRNYVAGLHSLLVDGGCACTIESKASGYTASYRHGKEKRVTANFTFRKSGMLVRIYGENINSYVDCAAALPADMRAAVAKAGDCKRLTSGECSPSCPTGYDFVLDGQRLQKCRYSCFLFKLSDANNPHIQLLLQKELACRAALAG